MIPRRLQDGTLGTAKRLFIGGPEIAMNGLGTIVYYGPNAKARNPHSGSLRPLISLGGDRGVAVTLDGRHVYTTDAGSVDRLTAYRLTCEPFAVKARLVLKNVGNEALPGNDLLKIKGEGVLTLATFDDLDPVATGGSFAGKGTVGWRLNGKGTAWAYIDRTGAPVNGVTKMKVQDRSARLPGQVKIFAKGKNGDYPWDHLFNTPVLPSGDCFKDDGGTRVTCKH